MDAQETVAIRSSPIELQNSTSCIHVLLAPGVAIRAVEGVQLGRCEHCPRRGWLGAECLSLSQTYEGVNSCSAVHNIVSAPKQAARHSRIL